MPRVPVKQSIHAPKFEKHGKRGRISGFSIRKMQTADPLHTAGTAVRVRLIFCMKKRAAAVDIRENLCYCRDVKCLYVVTKQIAVSAHAYSTANQGGI